MTIRLIDDNYFCRSDIGDSRSLGGCAHGRDPVATSRANGDASATGEVVLWTRGRWRYQVKIIGALGISAPSASALATGTTPEERKLA